MTEHEKTKIMAVDDQDINVRLMTHYLESAGFGVVPAYDGNEVVEMLEINPDVKAILLDRMMPHVSGLDALKHLKSIKKYRDIPVIMVTAAWSPELETEAMRAGAFAYLTKPYDKNKIISAIWAALGTHR